MKTKEPVGCDGLHRVISRSCAALMNDRCKAGRKAEQQRRHANEMSKNLPSTLKAVNRQEINTHLDGTLGMSDGGALVKHNDASLLEGSNNGTRAVTSRLDNFDALINHNADVSRVVWRDHGRQEGQVDAEGLVGHSPALADLLPQALWRREDEGRNNAQATSIRHGGCE